MEKPEMGTQAEGSAGGASTIVTGQLCPNSPTCQRWHATDGGVWCRLCWRDYTHPQPVRISEGRA